MPILLITGQPGNGKTAIMMEHMHNELKKDNPRPVFSWGIDGLKSGFGIVLEDIKLWNSKDAAGNHIVPDGSIIYVDEAWKEYGQAYDAPSRINPPHVIELAEHRHRGLDFVWTTQQTRQLYGFTHGLIGEHWHAKRRYGTSFIDVYKWGELVSDTQSTTKRESAQKESRLLPKHVFDMYQSATIHTIQPKIPWKVIALPFLLIGSIVLAYNAYRYLRPEAMTERLTGVSQGERSETGNAVNGSNKPLAELSVQELLNLQTAKIPAQPWTAPIFGDIEAESEPMIYCMSSDEKGDNPDCNCLTEQGTAYLIPLAQCFNIARNGLYNPNKEPSETKSTTFSQEKTIFLPVDTATEGSLRMGEAL